MSIPQWSRGGEGPKSLIRECEWAPAFAAVFAAAVITAIAAAVATVAAVAAVATVAAVAATAFVGPFVNLPIASRICRAPKPCQDASHHFLAQHMQWVTFSCGYIFFSPISRDQLCHIVRCQQAHSNCVHKTPCKGVPASHPVQS